VGFAVVSLTEFRKSNCPAAPRLPSGQVRPQVSGVLMRRLFTEGQLVHQGQPLYQIDPSVYRAAADQAAANLTSAQASAEAAKVKADRYKPLAADQAVAQQDYTDAAATARTTAASVAQYRAALNAPGQPALHHGSGAHHGAHRAFTLYRRRAGHRQSDRSALGDLDARPDLCRYSAEQRQPDEAAQAFADGGIKEVGKVKLILEDGSQYPIEGTLEFSEVTVDTATGTVALRAKFANPDGTLLPGLFVRTRVSQGNRPRLFWFRRARSAAIRVAGRR
jgi:membrane fusion protein (multidrug efflux system)